MIALNDFCDVSLDIEKVCLFNLGHFTTFWPSSLAGFLACYDSYTGNICFSHYFQSISYQSNINNS